VMIGYTSPGGWLVSSPSNGVVRFTKGTTVIESTEPITTTTTRPTTPTTPTAPTNPQKNTPVEVRNQQQIAAFSKNFVASNSGGKTLRDLVNAGVLPSFRDDATVVGSKLYNLTEIEVADRTAQQEAMTAYFAVLASTGDATEKQEGVDGLMAILHGTPGYLLASMLAGGPEVGGERTLVNEGSALLRTIGKNRVMFREMEVLAVRDLSHIDDATLMAMKDSGFAAKTVNGERLTLHHLDQNPSGPLVEMPRKNNNIWNEIQHPLGNTRGVGLSKAQRDAFNAYREAYWKARAAQELARRGR
jgi:hypothetical protein